MRKKLNIDTGKVEITRGYNNPKINFIAGFILGFILAVVIAGIILLNYKIQ